MNFLRPNPQPSSINGLTLPPLLTELAKAKLWKPPKDKRVLAEVSGIKDVNRLEFLKPERIAMETATLISLYEQGFGELYGLDRSKDGAAIPDTAKLDLRFAIAIAVNDDEEGIALDYRPAAGRPRVMAGTWTAKDDEPMRWRVIAPDFETFALQIGVITA